VKITAFLDIEPCLLVEAGRHFIDNRSPWWWSSSHRWNHYIIRYRIFCYLSYLNIKIFRIKILRLLWPVRVCKPWSIYLVASAYVVFGS
jgi:hypothetical protein